MIISRLEANKMHLRPTALFTNKAKWAFLITLCYIVLFFMMLFTQSPPLDWPVTAEFTKEFSMKTSLINNLCL